jgi:hypothetical protein
LPNIEFAAGPNTVFEGGSQIAAQSVRLGPLASAGDVFYEDTLLRGPGALFTPRKGYVPLFEQMPASPSFTAGTEDEQLSKDQSLLPGSFRDLVIRPLKTVTLTGGDYFFRSIDLGPGARLLASAPSTLHVTEAVSLGPLAQVRPLPTSTVRPSQLVVYALGSSGSSRFAETIGAGPGTLLGLNAYAPNGTIALGPSTRATGAFLAKGVDVGPAVTLAEDSAFVAP